MTLKEFAQQNGISPATARQWKRRGKITQTAEGFALREIVRGFSARDGRPVVIECDSENVTLAVTPSRAEMVTARCTRCDSDGAAGGDNSTRAETETDTLRAEILHWQKRVSDLEAQRDELKALVENLQDQVLDLESSPRQPHNSRSNYSGSARTINYDCDWGA